MKERRQYSCGELVPQYLKQKAAPWIRSALVGADDANLHPSMTVQGQEGIRKAELSSDFLFSESPPQMWRQNRGEGGAGGSLDSVPADKQLKNQVSHVAASSSAQALQFWSRGEEDDTTSPLCFHPRRQQQVICSICTL